MIDQVNLTKLISISVERMIRSLTTVFPIVVFRVLAVRWNGFPGPSTWEILLPKVPANPT